MIPKHLLDCAPAALRDEIIKIQAELAGLHTLIKSLSNHRSNVVYTGRGYGPSFGLPENAKVSFTFGTTEEDRRLIISAEPSENGLILLGTTDFVIYPCGVNKIKISFAKGKNNEL